MCESDVKKVFFHLSYSMKKNPSADSNLSDHTYAPSMICCYDTCGTS